VGLVMVDYAGTLHDKTDDRYEILVAGLPSSEVRSCAVDPENNVWVATPQGAAVWDGEDFRVFTTGNSGLLDNNVYRVCIDASSRAWFLCQNGLSIFDQVSGRWTNFTSQNSSLIENIHGINDFYTSLEIDNEQGFAAVGTQQGLSLLNFGTDTQGQNGTHLAVYPNPCVLGVHEWVVIDSLPDQSEVEVRTLEGYLVAKLRVDRGMHRAVWRPGRIASGIYLMVVSCPQGTRVERVAVISP